MNFQLVPKLVTLNDLERVMAAADPGAGGFVGFGRTPHRPGVVVENARTAWLYQIGQ